MTPGSKELMSKLRKMDSPQSLKKKIEAEVQRGIREANSQLSEDHGCGSCED